MKKMPTPFIVGLLQTIAIACTAQDTTVHPTMQRMATREKAIFLLVGYHGQSAVKASGTEYLRRYLELGVHSASIFNSGIHGAVVFTHGLSVELAPEANPIWGFKYGAWISGGVPWALGLNAIYYTDFDYGNFKIRPEFGFGAGYVKAVVGFNIPTFWNKDFKRLRRSSIQLSLCAIPFKLKTISVEKRPKASL